jgi:hypothetical protein
MEPEASRGKREKEREGKGKEQRGSECASKVVLTAE